MKRARLLMPLICMVLLAVPASAYAVTDGSGVVVPGWLSYATGILGLGTAVLLLVDAIMLKRVSEGSMISDNIVYMMLGVVCIATSVLVRWGGTIAAIGELTDFISFAADLLITAGMALLAVYFIRVRTAMMRYLRSVQAYKESAGTDEGPVGG